MADTKISAETALTAISGEEQIPVIIPDGAGWANRRAPLNLMPWPVAAGIGALHTGDTSETTLATVTLPGGALGPNGQVEIEAHWRFTNSANDKLPRIKFGGTTYNAPTITTSAGIQTHVRIANANSASSQRGFASNQTVGFGATTGAAVTSTVDTASDVTILFTGQLETAGEEIELMSYVVKAFYFA